MKWYEMGLGEMVFDVVGEIVLDGVGLNGMGCGGVKWYGIWRGEMVLEMVG